MFGDGVYSRIHTRTGNFLELAGVNTERKRQSSVPKPEEVKLYFEGLQWAHQLSNSEKTLLFEKTHIGASFPWGHRGGYVFAEIVVLLFTAGACGFCHLNDPIGDAAYRILNLVSKLFGHLA